MRAVRAALLTLPSTDARVRVLRRAIALIHGRRESGVVSPSTQPVTSMIHDFVADFQRLVHDWSAAEGVDESRQR